MKVMIRHILSEYNRLGYSTTEYNEMSHATLVRTDISGNEEKNKAIVILCSPAFNLRNSKDALQVAERLVKKSYTYVDRANIFVIVYASGGKAHHFASNRVAYFNWGKRTVSNKFYAGTFTEEAKVLNDIFRYEKVSAELKKAKYPERKLHFTIMIIVVIAVTVLAYIATLKSGNLEYGYYANTLMSGETYRYITYLFVHGSFRHLIGNMMALYVFGRIYMKYEGVMSFSIVYLVGGIFAAAFDSLYCLMTNTHTGILTVGASGAIMAIIGAITSECFTHPDFEAKRSSILLSVIPIFILNNIGIGINVRCHVFGFLAGIMLGFLTHILSMIENDERIKSLEKKKSKITLRSTYFGS